MPSEDRTGPTGSGSMTGRGMGQCGDGKGKQVGGQGRGGRGRGAGMGRRMGGVGAQNVAAAPSDDLVAAQGADTGIAEALQAVTQRLDTLQSDMQKVKSRLDSSVKTESDVDGMKGDGI